MKSLEQEIIDMDNFYATATIEEALAYFKSKANQCINVLIGSVDRLKKAISGMCRFFVIQRGVSAALRSDMTIDKIYLNTERPLQTYLQSLDDKIAMEELLQDALLILKR